MQAPATTDVLERRDEIEHSPRLDGFSTLRRIATDPQKRFVVSLGGGCVPALCGNAALVGLLEELELREHVAEVWGTSSGAIIGGSWASGTRASTIISRLHTLQKRRMVDIHWLYIALGFLLRPFGGRSPDALIRGRRFHRALLSGLAVETFEECPIPFRCIACTDDPKFRRKVFREGPLAPAISASMSLPGLLLPRGEDGRPSNGFYDGGLAEKTPLYSPIADHARLADGRQLFILATHYSPEDIGVARGFTNRFLATIHSLEERLWEYQSQEARYQPGVNVLILNPHIDDPSSFDFSRIERNYLHAREAFKDKLQNANIALTLGGS